jgi:plasmid maintenance system antidote protein VapI
MTTTPFQRFIDTLIDRYGTSMAIAEAIGMSRSAFARGVKHEDTLSEDNLLRLAEAAGEDPGKVLRLAGKGDFADRVERLYGAPRAPLSTVDRTFLALDERHKRALLRVHAELASRRK